MLLLHPQPSSYERRFWNFLTGTVKELTQESDNAKVANPFKAYLTSMRGATHTAKESVVNAERTYHPITPLVKVMSGTPTTGLETDENHRGKRYRQKKNNDIKSHGENSKPKKYSEPSASDGKDYHDERDDVPDAKKG